MKKFMRGERRLKPIRALSISLGLASILIGVVLYFLLREPGPPPPLFRWAFVSLSFELWCGLFLLTGVGTLAANIVRRGTSAAHAFGVFVWGWWAILLTVGTTETGLATSGYSFLCAIAAIAYWVCAAYWEWEYSRGRQ